MACKQKFRSVQWLRLCASTEGAWVQSLVLELRSHMRQKKEDQFIFRDFPGGSGLNSFTKEFYQTQKKNSYTYPSPTIPKN